MATDENGLYYMRARYYNPDIKVGDIGSSQGMNRYAYCEGNPASLVDPFGLSPESTQDQGQKSKYEFWHNIFGAAGIVWDGFDLINGVLYAAEGDYVNAALSFACGIPVIGAAVTAVAKTAKFAKYATTAAKIAKVCRDVGKVGNTAASVKALYDTYQTAQRECKTTGGKVAYIAGTLATGYLMGKAAQWGVGKLKNLASKALPKLKTVVQESAGKLVSRINKGFSSSGSGHMNRNRGFAVNPFYKGGSGKIWSNIKSKFSRYNKVDINKIYNNPKDDIFIRKPGGYDDESLAYNLNYINTHGKVKLDGSNVITAYDLGDGTFMLQNGHHRFKAAKKAGLNEFPIQKILPYEISVEDGIIDLPRGLEPKDY